MVDGDSPNDRDVLRDALRQLRRHSGLRQIDLAERLGWPQSVVSKNESGERRLDILELREVCHVCGVSLTDFVNDLERKLTEHT